MNKSFIALCITALFVLGACSTSSVKKESQVQAEELSTSELDESAAEVEELDGFDFAELETLEGELADLDSVDVS